MAILPLWLPPSSSCHRTCPQMVPPSVTPWKLSIVPWCGVIVTCEDGCQPKASRVRQGAVVREDGRKEALLGKAGYRGKESEVRRKQRLLRVRFNAIHAGMWVSLWWARTCTRPQHCELCSPPRPSGLGRPANNEPAQERNEGSRDAPVDAQKCAGAHG